MQSDIPAHAAEGSDPAEQSGPGFWQPDLANRSKPVYLAIADAIADDVRSGRLAAGHRLPPQRALAVRLEVDLTTVSRAYGEARRRGLPEQ